MVDKLLYKCWVVLINLVQTPMVFITFALNVLLSLMTSLLSITFLLNTCAYICVQDNAMSSR